MLKSLTQQSHPKLWLLFQKFFGATHDKQRLAMSFLANHLTVLEIGCSLGVVSAAFSKKHGIEYLGIDIDEQAIAYAKKRFSANLHMNFSAKSLESLVNSGQQFDYVLFANILHHVDDKMALQLLTQAARAVAEGGVIVLMEPDILHAEDGLLIKTLYALERGEYRRSLSHLISLAREAGINLSEAATHDISIGLLPGIVCGHMLVLSGSA
jgi:2-polyprenyl-3-methyl-5-hydroxy-6-metoxy-1,4-benzoquinol methylase